MGKKKDNESVMQNKDCNIEMTDVASNTDVCRQKNKNKSVMLNKDFNIEIKKTAMLNKDCNSKERILINDRTEEGIDKCNYQEITDCPVSFDINTIMNKNNNWNNESVTQNKDCNIQAKKIVILNKDYSNKEMILINDKTEEGIDKCNYQEVADCPVSFDINTIIDKNNNWNNESVTQTKYCNIEMTDVASNTGVYKATKENNDYLKADLQTSCDINTMSFINDRKNKSVMLNTDCNIEAKKTVILNKDCNNKERILIDDKTGEGIDKYNYQEITDCPVSFDNTMDVFTCSFVENDFLQTDNIDDANISLSCLLNTSVYENLDKHVKKLSFNTTEELSMSKDTCILPTCQNEIEVCNTNINVSISPSPLDVEDEESGSEYIPSEDDHDLLDNNDEELPQIQKSIVTDQNITASSISSLDASKVNNDTSVCDDENMYVDTSDTKIIKQNYCMFCSKLQTQLARHLETVHRNEPDVRKFAILPKNNPERRTIIDTLRKNGNFKFNTQSKLNNGKLIVCRRPNKKHQKDAKDFTVCAKCKDFFAKSTIRHHSRNCFGKKFTKNKCIMIMGRKIVSRLHLSASKILKKDVFPVMRDDEVSRVIRYDELLISYANKLCIKYKSQHHHDMIRARLRLLGRFFLAMKDINTNIENFDSIYDPKIYDDCICAINKVAKYNPEEKMYETPAVASNLSTLIKHIGNVLIMECIKRENAEKKKQVKDFLKLLVVDIGTSINATVMETQSTRRRHRKVHLPSVEDIQKLYKHLKKKRTEAFLALQQSFSYCHWISLAEVTLTSTHVFNRRRAGEIERVLIEDFNSYEKLNKNMYNDIYKSLSTESRKIAEKYIRFCIRGKLGRTVPVLLPNDLFQSILLILKFRKQAGVSEKNPYVFGLPGYNKGRYKYLRACALIRKFSEECDASQSSTLRGTILRKHVATYCIQLNLNDVEISDLATFMGHSDKIHKDHYRQPLISRDIVKISQYLETVQGNTNNPDENLSTDNSSENDEVLKENNSIDKEKECVLNEKEGLSSASPYGSTKRTRWSQEEKEIALKVFSEYMKKLKLPSLREIQTIRKKYTSLAKRTSPQIKTWLHNQQKALQRK